MSVNNFIPQIWSARLLANLDKSLVFMQMCNTDYEGEISQFGDTVHINQMGEVQIHQYTGADLTPPHDLDSNQVTLTIDQAHYFNFRVRDVDAAQANVALLNRGTERAAYASALEIDTNLSRQVINAGFQVGLPGTPIRVNVSNAYDLLVTLGVKFDEKNVPLPGRRIVLPPWYFGLLARDPRFTQNFNVLQNGIVENAIVGRFQLLMSNNVFETDGIFHCMAGTQDALSFAMQINQVEAFRPEANFADAMKGLVIYGRKVIQPACMGNFIIALDESAVPFLIADDVPVPTVAETEADTELKTVVDGETTSVVETIVEKEAPETPKKATPKRGR